MIHGELNPASARDCWQAMFVTWRDHADSDEREAFPSR